MRIAINGYVGPKKTGIGVVAEEFINRLAQNNPESHEYLVFCNHDSELRLQRDKQLRLIYYPVSRKSSLKNLLWTTFIYPFQCWKFGANLSIIPNVTALIFKTCPTIVMIYDLIEFRVSRKFDRLRMLYRRIAVPLTARRADTIVTVSQASQDDIATEFGGHLLPKIKIIYPGVRTINAHRAAQENLEPLDVPEEYLLYVGTVDHPGKNGIALVRIFSKLPKRLQENLYIVYAGKQGPGYEYILREIEMLRIKDRVIFLGYVPEVSLPDLYAKCKVFIFPSRYEGFGLPVIEAMHYGAPVITARNSSLIEAAGDAGLLFDPDDMNGMAEAVEQICEDPEYRARLIAKGKEHVKNFSWEKNCEQWKDLINSWDNKNRLKLKNG